MVNIQELLEKKYPDFSAKEIYVRLVDLFPQYDGGIIEHLSFAKYTELETINIVQGDSEDAAATVKKIEFGSCSRHLKFLALLDIDIEELDVSQCPELVMLDIQGGEITSLDISNNHKLVYFNGNLSNARCYYLPDNHIKITDAYANINQKNQQKERERLEKEITQQKKFFNRAWNKKLELEKLKNELINKENEKQTELLVSFLEAQEQITRLKSENSSSRLISFFLNKVADKQLSRTKDKLRKEKINEEKLEKICQLQEEIIKLQIELGIEEEKEEYEAQQEVPPRNN